MISRTSFADGPENKNKETREHTSVFLSGSEVPQGNHTPSPYGLSNNRELWRPLKSFWESFWGTVPD